MVTALILLILSFYYFLGCIMARPSKTKYRKEFKGKLGGVSRAGVNLQYGSHGLRILESVRLTEAVIESARRVVSRKLKRGGKIWISAFPHTPVSKKPADVRMGRGKGGVEFYVAKVRAGCILFEVAGVPVDVANEALMGAMPKLGVKCMVVENMIGGVDDR